MAGWGSIYNNTLAALRAHTATLARLEEQASSGARILRASDDPGDAQRIMGLQAQTASLTSYAKNLSTLGMDVDQATNVMQDTSTALTRVKQLLSQAASDTYGEKDRIPISEEINSILEQVVSNANTTNMGRYLFAGSATGTKPYAVTRVDGKIVSVDYQGADEAYGVPVAPGISASSTFVGEDIFRSDGRQSPTMYGTTGAAVGAGTSTIQGDAWLSVSHLATTFGGATGLAAGSSSAAGDTIAGDHHRILLDADAHTIRLDDGQSVTFDGTETDLQLTNAAGDAVHVDLTGLDAGLTGAVDVAVLASVRLTVDDGTSVDVTSFSGSLAVTDPDGRVLYVKVDDITRTGGEPVRVPGTYSLFDTLINIRDVLANARNLSHGEQVAQINQALDSVEEVSAGVVQHLTSLGARSQAMEGLTTRLEDMQDSAKAETNQLKDADTIQVAMDLARFQTFYEMTLTAASKMLNLSLLDYLQ